MSPSFAHVTNMWMIHAKRVSHVSHMNESCLSYEWVMPQDRMSHIWLPPPTPFIMCHTWQNSSESFIHTATQYNTLQHTVIHRNTLQHTYPSSKSFIHTAMRCNTLQTLQHTATHCNIPALPPNHSRHTATHCNTLQHTATHMPFLQITATHCNALQHTATHCNTMQQHSAKECNTL